MEVLQEFSGSMDVQIKGVKEALVTLQQRVASIEKNMVTKTYLDGKLGDLHYDLVMRMHKEDEMVLTKVAKMIG